MRKTANQANKFAEAEREKPALERCCLAAEAGFDRLIGMTNYFLSKTKLLSMKTLIFQLETQNVCFNLFTFVYKMKIVSDERIFKLYLQLLDLLFRTHLIRSFHGNLPQPTLRIVSKLDSMRNALYVEGTMQ